MPIIFILKLTAVAFNWRKAMSKISDLIYIAANKELPDKPSLSGHRVDLPCIFSDVNSFDYKQAEEKLANELLQAGIGLDKRETKETLAWLINGKFRGDFEQLIVLALQLPGDQINALMETIRNISIRKLINEIVDEELIIHKIHNFALVKQERTTLITLLSNDSFARALIVYANINGVPLEQGHIDFIIEQLGKENLDISILIESGKNILKQKYMNKYHEIKNRLESTCV